MRFGIGCLVAAGLATSLLGCTGRYQSDFPIVVANRVVNAIEVLADGNSIGQVSAGQTGNFSLHLSESGPNVYTNGVAPTPQAEVTLSARDMKTGVISSTKGLTVSQSVATYVTFASTDFPATGPTVSRFTFSPTSPGINQDVSFNGTSSSASNGIYAWDFGDGATGRGVTVTHPYARAGTFTVSMTVTSDNGAASTSSRTVTVSAALPPTSATFTFSPTNPAINQDIVFTAGGQGTGIVTGATYFWDFGDGSSGTGSPVTHRYPRQGTYTVLLRVSNDIGQSATSTRTVTTSATSNQIVARFTFSPTAPGINQDVFFNASASTVDSGTFSWDFGDGSSRGSGVTTTHQYVRGSTYTVTLTVTNGFGQSSTTSSTVTVSATSTLLVADFTFSPTDPSLTRGTNTVIFDATPSTGAREWSWDYGDGSSDAGRNASHTFLLAGTWVVRLTITDSAGRTATTTKSVQVSQ